MDKQSQQNRLAKNNRNELMVEQNLTIDDNLLPNAAELEKLKEVDPNIIQWILKHAEIEQSARIELNREHVKINDYSVRKVHQFNFTALLFGFILFLSVLILSAFFYL